MAGRIQMGSAGRIVYFKLCALCCASGHFARLAAGNRLQVLLVVVSRRARRGSLSGQRGEIRDASE